MLGLNNGEGIIQSFVDRINLDETLLAQNVSFGSDFRILYLFTADMCVSHNRLWPRRVFAVSHPI